MKKTLRNLLLLSTVSIFTVSCEKDEPSQSGTGQSNNNNERIVYVAGYQEVKGVKTAVLWKNGTPAYLTSGTHESQAYSVSVNGNDVYVVGYATFDKSQVAAIWVNEKIYPLSYNRSKAYAISTRGQEIYVAGDVENKAAYWKGIEEQLPIQLNKNNNSHAYAIFANDKDVLIAGSRGSQTPAIWDQTGKETAISTTGADNISSIFISGDDVYIGGTSYSTNPQNKKFVATYWKNNKAHQLTDGTRTGHAFDESAANSVYVKGQDVYVAGNLQVKTAKEIATVWKVQAGKTEEILLTNSSAEPAVARSIVVDNKNSMHVSGYHRFNKTYKVATLWVDGKPTYLADKNVNSEAYGVFVKE